MFLTVKEALISGLEYTGDCTAEVTRVQYENNEKYYSENIKETYSPAKDIGYLSVFRNETMHFDEDSSVYKLFVENGQHYLYKEYDAGGEGELDKFYYKLSEYSRNHYNDLGDDIYLPNNIKNTLWGTHEADSFTELENAYKEVYKQIVDNSNKFGSIDGYYNAAQSTSLDIYEDNGSTTLNIKVTFSYDDVYNRPDFSDYTERVEYAFDKSVTVKEGKVVEIYSSIKETYESDGEKESFEIQTNVKYTYEFDQKGYDEINIVLPNAEEIQVKDYTLRLKFITDNITHKDEYFQANESEDLYEKLINHLNHEYWTSENWETVCVADFLGFYYDEERKNPITRENLTFEKLMQVKTIYVDTYIHPEYAVTRSAWQDVNNLPKAYRIVLGDAWMNQSESSSLMSSVYKINGTKTFEIGNFEILGNVYLNGEKYTEDSFIIEAGKEYHILYEYVWSESTVYVETVYDMFDFESYK